jgi:integrase
MASLHRDNKDAHFRAAFTLISGRSRKQLKRTTATTNRTLATRIALHYEDASQGRVDVAAAKEFFERISDLRTRRIVAKVTDNLMVQATGRGLGGNTTREFLTDWLRNVRGEIGIRSYDRYAHATRRFLEILGPRADVGISEIGVEDIERWRDQMGEKAAAATVTGDRKILRNAFQAAVRKGHFQTNVVSLVKPPTPDAVVRRGFTKAELGRLLAVAKGEMRGLILCGFYTGARLRDVCLLRWRDIDLEENVWLYTSSKTERAMEVPIAAGLREWLVNDAEAKDDPDAFVFPAAGAVVMRAKLKTVGAVSGAFYELLVEAGLAPRRSHQKVKDGKGRSGPRNVHALGFHSLRYTATSELKKGSAAEAVARDLIGHDSAAVSRHYTEVGLEVKRDAVAKMPSVDDLLAAATATKLNHDVDKTTKASGKAESGPRKR